MPTIDDLGRVHPTWLALAATVFTWAVTAMGAALVFLVPRVEQRLLDQNFPEGTAVAMPLRAGGMVFVVVEELVPASR